MPGRLMKKIAHESTMGVQFDSFQGNHAARSMVTWRLRSSGTTMNRAMLKSPIRTSVLLAATASQLKNCINLFGQ